ncbi:MAG: hypothetical protein MI754_07365 [Chromatiales bacterium]|nr:hypothetical protein [Chromatiales bacterium]
MKFLQLFHSGFVSLFAIINGVMIYLFLMKLPYGLDPLLISLQHWDQLSPQIGIMLTIAVILVVVAILLPWRLSTDLKNRLLYMQGEFSHPASNAFLNNRRQPFESSALLQAHPSVKDSGFSRKVQREYWQKLHDKHANNTVVLNTRIHWQLLRDLFVISLLFLTAFVVSYLAQMNTPFQLVAIYLFVFGAQVLFLFLTARRIGWKLVDNVLAVDLGMKEGDTPDSRSNSKKKR